MKGQRDAEGNWRSRACGARRVFPFRCFFAQWLLARHGVQCRGLTAEGILAVVLPETEVELATACSGAHLIPYKAAPLGKPMSSSAATIQPAWELARQVTLGTGPIGTSLKDGVQGTPYSAVNRFRMEGEIFLRAPCRNRP